MSAECSVSPAQYQRSVAVSLSQTSRVLGFFISGAVAELLGRRRTIIGAR